MDKNDKKENLKLLYTICLRELNTAKVNIDLCIQKVNEVALFISDELEKSHNSQVYLLAYAEVLSYLSQISDFIRKFNVKCELTMFNQIAFCSNKLNDIEINKKQKIEKVEQFTYSKSQLDKYEKDFMLECFITFIEDKTNGLFYMNDRKNLKYTKCVEELIKYKENTPKILDHYPNEGELFGLIIDDYMFRAVRENDQFCARNGGVIDSYNAFLIDTGEIINVTLSNMKAYSLPSQCVELPGQAVLCKLEMSNSNDVSVEEYLEENLYAKTKFVVIKNENSILHVKLIRNTNPFLNILENRDDNNLQIEEKVETVSDPYYSYYSRYDSIQNIIPNNINNSLSNNTNNIDNTLHNLQLLQHQQSQQLQLYNNTLIDFSNLGLFHENNLNEINHSEEKENEAVAQLINFNDSNDNNNNSFENVFANTCDNKFKQKNNEIGLHSMACSNDSNNDDRNKKLENQGQYRQHQNQDYEWTDEDLAILEEEPLNTTNALKAVLGYIPKDDKRICPFYNPKTGSCFKGSRCRLEHIEKIRDGWTRDEAETETNIRNELILPPKRNIVNLYLTHVIDMQNFYAQYWTNNLQSGEKIKELVLQMNSEKEKKRYTPLNDTPVPFQLVIAKHNDNVWYRARIADVLDDYTYKVFYVDYGGEDIVTIDKIRKWESKFDYLPFQAIKCQIAGIEAKKENSIRNSGIERLKRMINHVLKAEILDYICGDELLVQLYDEDGYNVGEQLIVFGYANEKEIQFMRPNQLLPG